MPSCKKDKTFWPSTHAFHKLLGCNRCAWRLVPWDEMVAVALTRRVWGFLKGCINPVGSLQSENPAGPFFVVVVGLFDRAHFCPCKSQSCIYTMWALKLPCVPLGEGKSLVFVMLKSCVMWPPCFMWEKCLSTRLPCTPLQPPTQPKLLLCEIPTSACHRGC